MENVVAAFAVAPLAGALLVAGVGFLMALAVGPSALTGVVGTAFALTAGIGYVAAVLLGIPGFLLFRRLRWVGSAHWVLLCASVGAVTGAVMPAAVTLAGDRGGRLWAAVGVFLVIGAVVGAASGLLFARTIKIKPPASDEIAATFD
ncbi:MAG TPA: hypothetical protein VLV76_29135 [Candidatus Acidoferrum sp.]|nr:hypothetical protein [Candidatus Acidoferrum sp.]